MPSVAVRGKSTNPSAPRYPQEAGQEDARFTTHWWWHIEVHIRINGEMPYPWWREVDHEGDMLESFARKRCARPNIPLP